jgi:hypothetical protein
VTVDPLAQIEDEVGPPDAGEPAEVPQPNREELDLVPTPPEHIAHLVDVGHYGRDVLGTPILAARIEQDCNFHQATSARSERPLIRRHAISATVRMRSS